MSYIIYLSYGHIQTKYRPLNWGFVCDAGYILSFALGL